jgi:hypothetical protein
MKYSGVPRLKQASSPTPSVVLLLNLGIYRIVAKGKWQVGCGNLKLPREKYQA